MKKKTLMISWNIQMTGDDEGDDFAPIRTTPIGLIPIRNLFDFKATHWHSLFTRTALQSFDDELATYELLDWDAQVDWLRSGSQTFRTRFKPDFKPEVQGLGSAEYPNPNLLVGSGLGRG